VPSSASSSWAFSRAAGYSYPALELIHLAGLPHYVGKIAVPDAVLLKPDRLSDAEFADVKKHPAKGEEMLRQLAYIDPAILPAVRGHHERWDGRGYQDRLGGNESDSDAAPG